MKKVFISQPMRGLTDEEIIQQREILKNKIDDIIEVWKISQIEKVNSQFIIIVNWKIF